MPTKTHSAALTFLSALCSTCRETHAGPCWDVAIERLDAFARAVAREAGSCETCLYWLETTKPRAKQRKGECQGLNVDAVEIRGGSGCGECDPCGMNAPALVTTSTFRCNGYVLVERARAAQQETPSSVSDVKTKT